jgi:hypothetical protein
MLRRVAALFVAAATLPPAMVAAQQVIRAAGTVRDEAGSPIRGAVVTAVNPDNTPPQITATSNDKGQFGVIGIRRGMWTFTIDAPGYDPVTIRQPIVAGSRQAPFDVRLAKTAAPAPRPMDDVKGIDIQQQIDRAEALAASADLDASIAAWRAVLARVPALTMVHLRLGELLERKADHEAALAAYRKLLEIEPGNVKAREAVERLAKRKP